MNKYIQLSFVVLFFTLASSVQAIAILPFLATPNGNGITENDLSFALDGNLGTGYQVTNTNGNAQGFNIRFDFDISAFSQVDAFSFDFTGIYTSDSPSFQKIRFGASPGGLFTRVDTPIGQQINFVLTTTSTGSGFSDTDNYISGNTLSVFLQTELGNTIGTFTAINSLEISANIDSATSIPEPTSLALLCFGLAAIGFSRYCQKARG